MPTTTVLAAAGPLPLDVSALLLVLLAAWAAGWAARRAGMPAVLGELLAGILLGPPLLGLLSDGVGLEAVAEFGILLMMLAIGLHVDLDDVVAARGPGVLAAIGGFVVPAAAGTAVLVGFGYEFLGALFVGLALGVTSLATKSRILNDLDLFGTRIAHVLVAGALLSDTAILVAFAGVLGFVELGTFDIGSVLVVVAEVVGYVTAVLVIGRGALPRLATWLATRGLDRVEHHLTVIVAVALVFGVGATWAGLHPLLGTFLAGMMLRAAGFGGQNWREAEHLLDTFTMRLLAPVFFVTAGFLISFRAMAEAPWMLLAVFTVACLGKIVGTALFYLPSGRGWREGVVVGAGMNGRGAVEIIVAGIGLDAGIIDEALFTVLVFTAIATTATVPPLLTLGVRWLRSRGDLAAESTREAVLLVGGGPIGLTLGHAMAEGGRRVTVIDTNSRQTAMAREIGLEIVAGDALDEEVLVAAEVAGAGMLVATTGNAEVNVLAARLARERFGVPHVQAALGTASAGLREVARDVGVTPMLPIPVDLHEWDGRLAGGSARPVWYLIGDGDDRTDGLDRAESGLPLVVERDGVRLPYPAAAPVGPGDRVLVLELFDLDEEFRRSAEADLPERAGAT